MILPKREQAPPDGIPQDVWDAAGKLLDLLDTCNCADCSEDAARAMMAVQLAAKEAQREADAKLIEEGFTKVVGQSYASDGVTRSKNDYCPHQRYMYEDCDQCCADAIRKGSQ